MLQQIERQMQKLVSIKKLAFLLTVLYVGSIIPLLMIGQYNVPSADDFSIGMTCRAAWIETHSVLKVLWQAVLMAWNDYFHWMGYYTSIFLMSVHPGVFGERMYAATTWLMLASISLGTIYFLHALFVKLFKMDKYICLSITMIMLFVTVQCTIGRNEAFYWYCGAVNYSFIHGLELFFFGAVISMACDNSKRKRIWDTIIACILGFLVGGGNYMSSLNMCIIIITIIGILIWKKSIRKYRKLLIPFLFSLGGFMLSCLAPGNNVRASGATGMMPIKAVLISFYYCLYYCFGQWTNWVILLMVLVCSVLFWVGLAKTEFKFPYPIAVILFSYGILSAMITPPLFAVGNIGAGRLQALIFIMYILILVLDVGYVVGWFRAHFKLRAECGEVDFSPNIRWIIVFSAMFFSFGSVLCTIPNHHFYTCTSAVTDLYNGSAEAFGNAMQERFIILNDESLDNVILDELPTQPALIFHSDISDDVKYWENLSLSKGYNKTSVILRKKQ